MNLRHAAAAGVDLALCGLIGACGVAVLREVARDVTCGRGDQMDAGAAAAGVLCLGLAVWFWRRS